VNRSFCGVSGENEWEATADTLREAHNHLSRNGDLDEIYELIENRWVCVWTKGQEIKE
jgi:hypothetical protein